MHVLLLALLSRVAVTQTGQDQTAQQRVWTQDSEEKTAPLTNVHILLPPPLPKLVLQSLKEAADRCRVALHFQGQQVRVGQLAAHNTCTVSMKLH